MQTASIHHPIRSNILFPHFSVFAIHFITSFLWASSIVALPFANLLLISALISWLALRTSRTLATLVIMAVVFIRYWIWEASDSWFALLRIAVTTCFLLASRLRYCEMLQRFESALDSYRQSDHRILHTIRRESWGLTLWIILIASYCILASVLIFQTVSSQEDWLNWAQEKRVVLWPHPTLIVIGLFAFLCFKRWQWSTTVAEQCRLLLRREAIQILDPELGRIARIRTSMPQQNNNPSRRDER